MAGSTTIRIRETTRRSLADLAARRGRSITDVVDDLVERAEAEAMFDAHHEAMRRVGDEPEQAAAWHAEQRQLHGTLLDGLEQDPWPRSDRGEPAR
jgi:hypothetical protein